MKNKEYICNLLNNKDRMDGRKFNEYRDFSIEVNALSQANGLARVQLGKTEVLVGVKFNVGTPFPDSPDEGVLITSAEHPPMASKEFESGPPNKFEIEFARVTDRTIRESGALDFGTLVIRSGEKVWTVFVDVFPINDGGNLFDAAAIGAIIALKNARFPVYDEENDKVDFREFSKNKLKLEKIPILCSFSKIKDHIVLDATNEEEAISEGSLHIGTVDDGSICAMQMSGSCGFTDKEVKELVEVAIKKGKDLRMLLKKYL